MVSHVPERLVGLRRGIPEHCASTSCWGIGKLDVNLRNSTLGKAEPTSLSRATEQLWPSCDSGNDCRELSPQSRIFLCLTLKPRAWWRSVGQMASFLLQQAHLCVSLSLNSFPAIGDARSSKKQLLLFILSATLLRTNHWMRNCEKAQVHCSMCCRAGGLSLLAFLCITTV